MDFYQLLTLILLGMSIIVTVLIYVSNKKLIEKNNVKDSELERLKDNMEKCTEEKNKLKEQVESLTTIIEGSSYLDKVSTDPKERQPIPPNFDRFEEKVQEFVKKGGFVKSWDLLKIGNVEYWKSNYNKALHYNEVVLDQSKNDIELKAAALGNIGLIYQEKGKLDKALEYHKKSLGLKKEIGNKLGEATSLGNIGLVYQAKGDLGKALEYHNQALKLHKEVDYKKGVASSLGNFGLIYQDKGDWDKALEFYKKAIEIAIKINYKQGEASVLGNIGLVYQAKGDLGKAIDYYNQALKLHKEIGYKQGEAHALNNIGEIYRIKKDLDEALKCYNEALKIYKQIGDEIGIAVILHNFGEIHLVKKEYIKALENANEAYSVFCKIGYLMKSKETEKLIAKIEQQQKQSNQNDN